MDPGAAWLLTDMLREVVDRGTGYPPETRRSATCPTPSRPPVRREPPTTRRTSGSSATRPISSPASGSGWTSRSGSCAARPAAGWRSPSGPGLCVASTRIGNIRRNGSGRPGRHQTSQPLDRKGGHGRLPVRIRQLHRLLPRFGRADAGLRAAGAAGVGRSDAAPSRPARDPGPAARSTGGGFPRTREAAPGPTLDGCRIPASDAGHHSSITQAHELWSSPQEYGAVAVAGFQAEGSELFDVNGDALGMLATVNRRVVMLDSLPEYLPQAFLAVEDQRFYKHGGVDWRRFGGALLRNVRSGGVQEGGSTITMQLARNLFPEHLPYRSAPSAARRWRCAWRGRSSAASPRTRSWSCTSTTSTWAGRVRHRRRGAAPTSASRPPR
jgi:hypothetical protein